MLLLEEGLSLPLVNLKLPLLGYYVIGPVFYVVLHGYFLMMLVLLARTAKSFHDALEKTLHNENMREQFRMRIENALFLQIIIGALRERSGVNGRVLRAIALLSSVVAPIILLIMFQIMFLPYHHGWITWWHRAMIGIDLVLVWTLWPSYQRRWGERLLPRWHLLASTPLKTVLMLPSMGLRIILSIYLLAFSWQTLTYPGEPFYYPLKNPLQVLLTTMSARWGKPLPPWLVIITPFDNTLSLPNEDFVDDALLKRLATDNVIDGKDRKSFVPHSLADRDLTGANFSKTDMRRMNFRGAKLTNAEFDGAWLQGASFDWADLQGASFNWAQLQGVSLNWVQLQGATLNEAQLQGASLREAKLHGALLLKAQLQGAFLWLAQLQGASLWLTQLQGAFLKGAQLQGASLWLAQLQGATLEGANLQGASFERAQLQGVVLKGTQLQGASLRNASVWRTTDLGVEPNLVATNMSQLDYRKSHSLYDPVDFGSYKPDQWNPNGLKLGANDFMTWKKDSRDFKVWKDNILDVIPEGTGHTIASAMLEFLDSDKFTIKYELTEKSWNEAKNAQGADDEYYQELNIVLSNLACEDGSTAPHVARGLIWHRLRALDKVHLIDIAQRLKMAAHAKDNPVGADAVEDCPGARGLTESDLLRLDQLVKEASNMTENIANP